MLIGLHDVENDEEIARKIKERVDGFSAIYRPKDLAEYIDLVKRYHPKDDATLIITRSHYDETDHWSMDLSRWRLHEHFFAKKGGAMWGKDSPSYESATYAGEVESVDKIMEEAEWNLARAKHINKISGRLLGRSSMDPHTILVGYGLEYPSDSKAFRYIIGSLPEGWWQGVSFVRGAQLTNKIVNWFEYSNYVSLGENSHKILTEKGIEHGAIPLVPSYVYSLKLLFSKEFGIKVREISKTKEHDLDWTYPRRV